jgi:cytochrome o ubiquinol oxidase subunit 2
LKRAFTVSLLPLLLALDACHAVVLSPSGDVAVQQGRLVMVSTGLMLLVVLPVMAMTALFAWRYRASANARYEPEWAHATHLELIIWAAPLLIIICLGALTWVGTHLLDPYRPVSRIAQGRTLSYDTPDLQVQVVALDWKWLFIYPKLGIATVNELAVPLDTPLSLDITASSVMNSFYAPALAGQVYAMPGMQSELHAVLNTAGDYEGFSANYSGAGFSAMRFKLRGLSAHDFERWTADVKAAGGRLDREGYLQLSHPSENEPARGYATVDPELYAAVLSMCVEPTQPCHAIMAMARRQPEQPLHSAPLKGAGLQPPHAWFGSPTTTATVQRLPNP